MMDVGTDVDLGGRLPKRAFRLNGQISASMRTLLLAVVAVLPFALGFEQGGIHRFDAAGTWFVTARPRRVCRANPLPGPRLPP